MNSSNGNRRQNDREAAAEWAALDSLHEWDRNPRKNDGAPVAKVADSIIAFGFEGPIVARRENGEIIAGHTRWKACDLLHTRWLSLPEHERETWHAEAQRVARLRQAPVRWLDLSERDSRRLAVASNRIAEESKWDVPQLSALLEEWADDGGLEALGFDADEIERMTGGEDLTVESIDVSDLDARFWLTVSGPLPAQVDALDALRKALEALPGCHVHVASTKV